MLYFDFAQIVQALLPLAILRQVVGDSLGKKNVAGIATIHDSLRNIDPSASDIRSIVHIGNAADRTAVNAHAQLQLRMSFERFTDFQGTLHRRFWAVEEDQRHAIANRETDQFASCFGSAKVLGVSND